MSDGEGKTLTRHELLLRGGAAASGFAALGAFPPPTSAGSGTGGGFTGTLRVLGDGVTQLDAIKEQAEKDLGFAIAFDITDPDSVVEKAITQPGSFDVLAYYHFGYDAIWPTGSLRPVDTRRITRWKQVSDLFKQGKVRPLDPRCTYGQGDAPFRSMYVDDSGRYPISPDKPGGTWRIVEWVDERTGKPYGGLPEPRYVNGVPAIFNVDSIGYNARVIKRLPERVSWAELLNTRWRGRVALFSGAQVALLDTGIAAEAAGLMRFRNKGDMTKREIDRLVKILIRLKKQGQFHGFWNSTEAIDFMRSGEVVVEPMWAFHVVALQRQGFPVRYAAPPRASGAGRWALRSRARSRTRQAPGRLRLHQLVACGLCGSGDDAARLLPAVQATSRRFVDPAEWDYWIAGKPARRTSRDRSATHDPQGPGSRRRLVRQPGVQIRVLELHLPRAAYEERRWRDFVTA